MSSSRKRRCNFQSSAALQYSLCEPRKMLTTVTVDVGDLRSGVAVADDATGAGFIMYSHTDVHDRFSGISSDNADHFVAVQLDGLQWQYNNDSQWIDFEPEELDALIARVNFDGDYVENSNIGVGGRSHIEGIWFRQIQRQDFSVVDAWVVANQYGGQFDEGEFTVLGSTLDLLEVSTFPQARTHLGQIAFALALQQRDNLEFHGLANFDASGSPLLSWRVHLLPHIGLEDLYEQFNLDEPWNSPHNLALADEMPEIYKNDEFSSTNRTSFLAIAGEETNFQLDGTPFDWDNGGENRGIAFVEANESKAVIWSSPIDWYFDPSDPLNGLAEDEDGFAVAQLGGASHIVPFDTDPEEFANWVDLTDDSPVDFEALGVEITPEESIREIAFALSLYTDIERRVRPAIRAADGTPLLSWRVAILPYMGHDELYGRFNLDEPWNSANNLPLLSEMPEYFRHDEVPDGMTVYLGLDAPGALFDSSQESISDELIDGQSNTIAFVEADASEAIAWTRPLDLPWDATDPLRGLGSLRDDGRFNAGFLDFGFTSFATDQPEKIPAWVTFEGEEVNDYSLIDENHWRTPVGFKLIQVMQAAENHETHFSEFPRSIFDASGTTPLLSWRVRILPYIEQQALYDQFRLDEPWDSAHNLSLLPLMPPLFRTIGVENGKTVIQGAHGPNTLFSDTDTATSLWQMDQQFLEIAGALEVAPQHAIEWTKPGDFQYDPAMIRSIVNDPNEAGSFVSLGGRGSTFAYFYDTLSDDVLNKVVSPADYVDDIVDISPFWENSQYFGYFFNDNSLRQLAIGAQHYEATYSHFPHHATYSSVDDTPLLSWRVEILPFMGYEELYDLFHHDEPWDSPHNLSLLPLMPREFRTSGVGNGKTTFQAVTTQWDSSVGPQSIFPLTNDIDVDFGDISDGSSNTILFVETTPANAVEWTKPQDIVYDPANPGAGLGIGDHGQGARVVMADGQTRFVNSYYNDLGWDAAISPRNGDYSDFHLEENYQYGTVDPSLLVCFHSIVSITLSNDSTFVSESGSTDSYQLGLNWVPLEDITITIKPTHELDVGNGPGVPREVVFEALDDQATHLIEVSAVDDSSDEGLHWGLIEHEVTSADPDDHGAQVASSIILIADNDHLAAASPLLNEVYVNSQASDVSHEFIEIISEPSTPLTDVWLVVVEGEGADAGVINQAQELSSIVSGDNGLTLLGPDFSTSNPWADEVHSDTTLADLAFDGFGNGSQTILLVEGFNAQVGDDIDTNNDGVFNSLTWGTTLDSIALANSDDWPNEPSPDRVYSAASLEQDGIPDAATRIYGDDLNDSSGSWFNGEVTGANSVDYGAGSSNLPAGAVLTPGAMNYGVTAPTLDNSNVYISEGQRSTINQLTLTLEGDVEFDPDAFSVVQSTDGDGNSTGTAVPVTVSVSQSGDETIVVISFDGLTRSGSDALVDGNYRLTVDGSKVRRAGTDFTLGADFVYGDSADETFFSLFGDSDGNRTVNVFDLLKFRQAYRAQLGDSDFDEALDFNADGTVSVIDLLRFRQNYRKSLPWG